MVSYIYLKPAAHVLYHDGFWDLKSFLLRHTHFLPTGKVSCIVTKYLSRVDAGLLASYWCGTADTLQDLRFKFSFTQGTGTFTSRNAAFLDLVPRFPVEIHRCLGENWCLDTVAKRKLAVYARNPTPTVLITASHYASWANKAWRYCECRMMIFFWFARS